MGGKANTQPVWYYLQPLLKVVEDLATNVDLGLSAGTAQKNLNEYGSNTFPVLHYKGVNVLADIEQSFVTVIRGGKEERIQAAHVVPGDLVKLTKGDVSPADLRVVREIDGGAIVCNEFYTGSRRPTPINKGEVMTTMDPLLAPNMVFTAAEVIKGTILGICITTGEDTRIGKAVTALKARRKTKVTGKGHQRQLEYHGVKVSTSRTGALLMNLTSAIFDLSQFLEPMHVTHSVFGKEKVSHEPSLDSLKELAGANVLARAIILGSDYSILSGAVYKFSKPFAATDIQEMYPVLTERPYSAVHEFAMTVHRVPVSAGKAVKTGGLRRASLVSPVMCCGGRTITIDAMDELDDVSSERVLVVVRGTPKVLISSCTRYLDPTTGNELTMDDTFRKNILNHANEILERGSLPVGYCHRTVMSREASQALGEKQLNGGYCWVGLVGFSVEPRKNNTHVATMAKDIGIRLFIVGEESFADDPTLAEMVARKVGYFSGSGESKDLGRKVLSSTTAEELPEEDMWAIVKGLPGWKEVMFSSLNSHTLELLVDMLKEENHVVACHVQCGLTFPAAACADVGVVTESHNTTTSGMRQLAFGDATILDGNVVTFLKAIESVKKKGNCSVM